MTTTSQQQPTYFSVPPDPSFVYPLSAFPSVDIFEQNIHHPALIVPARRTAELRNTLSHALMHRPKIKNVYPANDAKSRKLVLKNSSDNIYNDPAVSSLLQQKDDGIQRSTHIVTLTFKDWTVEEVLRRLLPVDEVPSAFETVGHVAHVNLRPELLPYKHIIGKVILDKNAPRIRTVVNKVGSIETEYRTFGMEVLAGDSEEGWSMVKLKEEGCQYELDFRHVYWNSRLAGEHRRLVQLIQSDARRRCRQNKDGESNRLVVADLMAGVGPFAVPLAANGKGGVDANIMVHANDLNPTSYHYLKINATKNKCRNLHMYNMDGRAFVHDLDAKGIQYHHVLMNLPATAPEFLDAFRGFSSTRTTMPRIHVHCFGGKTDQAEQEAIDRCSKALGCLLDRTKHNVSVHIVRDVAPKKNMLCVSFDLPEPVRNVPRLVLLDKNDADDKATVEPPNAKRIKT